MKSLFKWYSKKIVIGWCEWCGLDKLNIPAIKVKVDTGAKTSALHAFDIVPYVKNGKDYVKFSVHPLQGNSRLTVKCRAPIIDERNVMSSNGHNERRFVIATPITMGGETWEIELTLSNRDPMRFRMLLGREAMGSNTIIVPQKTLNLGRVSKSVLKDLYSTHKRLK